jgi:hypothetical protein
MYFFTLNLRIIWDDLGKIIISEVIIKTGLFDTIVTYKKYDKENLITIYCY